MEEISKLASYGAVKMALGILPMREDDFYGQSIQRIKANEAQAERALQILAWILRAKRPMKIKEMQCAAVIIPGSYSMIFEDFLSGEGDMIDCCEGLVVILPESRTVTFAHPTVNEYLESAGNQIFKLDPEVVIARTCLTYLASDHPRTKFEELLKVMRSFICCGMLVSLGLNTSVIDMKKRCLSSSLNCSSEI
jgi:hypothetical protein